MKYASNHFGNSKMDFQKGDIFFSKNNGGLIHNLISGGQKYIAGDHDYKIIHAGIVVSDDLIVELGGKGIELNFTDAIKNDNFLVFRCRDLAAIDLAADLAYGLFEAGKSYAHQKAAVSVFVKNKQMTNDAAEKLLTIVNQMEFPKSLYCSEFVILVYECAKKIIGNDSANNGKANDDETELTRCYSARMNPGALYKLMANSADFYEVKAGDEHLAKESCAASLQDRISLLTVIKARIAKLCEEKRGNHYLLESALHRIEGRIEILSHSAHQDKKFKLSELPGLLLSRPKSVDTKTSDCQPSAPELN